MEDLREEAEVEQVADQIEHRRRLCTPGGWHLPGDSAATAPLSSLRTTWGRRRHDHYKVAPGDGASGGPTSTGSGPVRPQEV